MHELRPETEALECRLQALSPARYAYGPRLYSVVQVRFLAARPPLRGRPNGRERPAWCGPRVGHRGAGRPSLAVNRIIQGWTVFCCPDESQPDDGAGTRHPPAARPPPAWLRRSPRAHTPTSPSPSWRWSHAPPAG